MNRYNIFIFHYRRKCKKIVYSDSEEEEEIRADYETVDEKAVITHVKNSKFSDSSDSETQDRPAPEYDTDDFIDDSEIEENDSEMEEDYENTLANLSRRDENSVRNTESYLGKIIYAFKKSNQFPHCIFGFPFFTKYLSKLASNY